MTKNECNNIKYDKEFIQRFWNKVSISGEDQCWEWKAATQSKGYGSIGIGGGKTALAHRVAYEISNGEIPNEMHVLHKCDNRKCVNPKHLFLGTNEDNIKDKVQKGRQSKGEKHGNSKLTVKEVRTIRKLHKDGDYSYRQLAERFQISPSYVGSIVREEYWNLPLAE